jgi:hypothetical protein
VTELGWMVLAFVAGLYGAAVSLLHRAARPIPRQPNAEDVARATDTPRPAGVQVFVADAANCGCDDCEEAKSPRDLEQLLKKVAQQDAALIRIEWVASFPRRLIPIALTPEIVALMRGDTP